MPPNLSEYDSRKISIIIDVLRTPFVSTFFGAILILLGVTTLLISSLFLPRGEEAAGWLSLWGMIIVCTGGTLYSASTFINNAILISIGGIFLTVGLALFGAFLAWQLRDIEEEETVDNSDERAILGIISMIIVLVGIGFFIRKAIQRMVKPYFGPSNYNLYGSLVFGTGAFTFLFLNIGALDNVRDDDTYDPIEDTDKFGSFLFVVGAWLLLLAISRSYYCHDLLYIHDFPAITSLEARPREAFCFLLMSTLMTVTGFLFVTGEILTSGDARLRMTSATTVVLSVGFGCLGLIFNVKEKKIDSGLVLANCGVGFGVFLYGLGTGLMLSLQEGDDLGRHHYGDDMRTASMGIACLNGFFLVLLTYPYSVIQMFSVGNFYLIGNISLTAGFFCLFLSALTTSSEKEGSSCDIACSGTQILGSIFVFSGVFMYALFAVVFFDVTSVETGLENSKPFFLLQDIMYSILSYFFPKTNDIEYSTIPTDQDTETNYYGEIDLLDEIKKFMENGGVLEETDVIIVGCGPTGLTLANEVGQRGVKVVAFEARPRVIPDSRFFNLACPTVEGLKRIGVLEKILEKSLPQDFGHGSISTTGFLHSDMKIIAEAQGPSRKESQKLGHNLSNESASRTFTSKWAEQTTQRCMQGTQEQCLKELAEENENINVCYGWKLLSFIDNGNGSVYVKTQNIETNETRLTKGRFLVGCDGPGSAVSRLLKTRFDGFVNLGQTRSIFIHAPGMLAKIRHILGDALQYHIARPGFGVGWFVLNDAVNDGWTFFLVGLIDGRMPRQLSKEDMVGILREFIGPDQEFSITTDSPWFWNLFFARKWVFGRVILCGDSAHSWAPFGGIGGNTGYADASNLGWKLAAIIKGWANSSMLDSYELERREGGLRTILAVLNFTPDRSQIMRMAVIAQYPLLWFTVQFRWIFANSGIHSGNHFMSEGISFGVRYVSQLIYQNVEHQGYPPLENPPNIYHPAIVAGGRIPHVRFTDGSSMNDKVAFNGFTLLVVNPNVRVVDGILRATVHSDGDEEKEDFSIKSDLVRKIEWFFQLRRIPLSIEYIKDEVEKVIDPAQKILKKMYLSQSVILVRPDLYISWFLAKDKVEKISIFELQRVAQFSCCEIIDEKTLQKAYHTTEWMTRRFITNIQGYRSLHTHAIYVENEDKSEVIKKLSKKKDEKSEEEKMNNLLTKGKSWKEEQKHDVTSENSV